MYLLAYCPALLLTLLTASCLCLQQPSALEVGTAQQHCVCANESNSRSTSCKECRLLEECLADIHNDSLLSFFAGTHYLTRPWTITNISNVTFSPKAGGEQVTIQCTSENAGLQFVNVSSLTMKRMNIFRCGMNTTVIQKNIKSALIFRGGENLYLQYLNVSNSFVSGMLIYKVLGNVTVDRSNFTDANFSGDNMSTMGNAIIYFGREAIAATTVVITHARFERNKYENDTHHIEKDPRLSAGLSIIINLPNVSITLSHVTLKENFGRAGGNLAIKFFSTYALLGYSALTIENSVIERGFSNLGGGAFIAVAVQKGNSSKPTHIGNTSLPLLTIRKSNFTDNEVAYVGGGIYFTRRETNHTNSHGNIVIEGCSFMGNRIKGNGGLALHYTTLIIGDLDQIGRSKMTVHMSDCNFSQHSPRSSKLGDAAIAVKTTSVFSIANTTISNNNCTGLLAISSNILISGDVNISHNHAFSGGGVLLCSGAVLFLREHTSLSITMNTAEHTGGGVNVEMECIINKPRCFFQFDSVNILVNVSTNSAGYAGDNIYGGYLSKCYNLVGYPVKIWEVLHAPNNSLRIDSPDSNSSIASAPHQVCRFNKLTQEDQCSDVDGSCQTSGSGAEMEVYPGQKLVFDVIIVSRECGLIPGTVHAQLKGDRQYLAKKNALQKVTSRAPQALSYNIYSKEENTTAYLSLTVEEIKANPYSKTLELKIKIKKCPLGYTLHNQSTESHCSCGRIKEHVASKLTCYYSDQPVIHYSPPLWIGLVDYNSDAHPWSIAVSRNCPRDYCYLQEKLKLSLNNLTVNSSVQCHFNRSGVLCGGCQSNFSLILGSSECRKDCTNYHLFLIPVFALAGVLLVFVITFLNLTVSAGTIHGLVFYANVVQIYAALMFEENNYLVIQFLRIFLAWINLDFGFKTCFFRGMNGFSKALLQFVFPVYIWAIAGTVIFLSRRYAIVMKVLGENSVKVLATLILLSYTKVIRAAMDALHFTTITYLPGEEHFIFYHWSVDGQVKYLHDTHIVVFAVGVVFALASLPFILTLLCTKHIGRFSNLPFCSWIHRLKPFFDSYTGPLTDSGRFWVGLLLLARLFILGGYSFNMANSNAITMALTVVVCFVLLFIAMLLPRGIYKRHTLNVLEYFSLVNLGMLFLLVVCSLYYNSTKIRVNVVNLSAGCSFVVFVLVVLYHVQVKFKCLRHVKSLKSFVLSKFRKPQVNAMGYSHDFGHSGEESPLLSDIYDRR